MTLEELKNKLTALGYDGTVLFDTPDYADAFIGVTSDGRAVYDYDLMVESLAATGEYGSWDDAVEFVDYNTVGSVNPSDPKSPVILIRLMDE